MTWLDKYRTEHPDMSDRDIISFRCPPDACEKADCPKGVDEGPMGCVDCWTREHPESK